MVALRLSEEAEKVVRAILNSVRLSERLPSDFSPNELSQATGLNVPELNDSAEELRSLGFVTTVKTGAGPPDYNFITLQPSQRLYYDFAELLPDELDPREDPQRAAVAIVGLGKASEADLMSQLDWPLGRVTLAVGALAEAGAVTVISGEVGAPPVGFYRADSTAATRQLAKAVTK